MSPTNLIRLSARQCLVRSPRPMQSAIFRNPMQTRVFSHSPVTQYARKDSQDRKSIDTEATEYTKSGTDDGAAHTDDAFDPKKTDPGEEKADSEKGKGKGEGNPLDVSPANPEVSKPRGGQEGGAESSGKD